MPVLKREEWLKLNSTGKVIHRAHKVIDEIQRLQKRYDRAKASGKIKTPITFLEHSDPS